VVAVVVGAESARGPVVAVVVGAESARGSLKGAPQAVQNRADPLLCLPHDVQKLIPPCPSSGPGSDEPGRISQFRALMSVIHPAVHSWPCICGR
jgi:hypothetical protein